MGTFKTEFTKRAHKQAKAGNTGGQYYRIKNKLNSQAKHKKAQSKASLNKQGEQKLLKNKKTHTHTKR